MWPFSLLTHTAGCESWHRKSQKTETFAYVSSHNPILCHLYVRAGEQSTSCPNPGWGTGSQSGRDITGLIYLEKLFLFSVLKTTPHYSINLMTLIFILLRLTSLVKHKDWRLTLKTGWRHIIIFWLQDRSETARIGMCKITKRVWMGMACCGYPRACLSAVPSVP